MCLCYVYLKKFDDPQGDALVNSTSTMALSVAERHNFQLAFGGSGRSVRLLHACAMYSRLTA